MRLKLYKGSVGVVGRESPYSLYDQDLVTFEEGAVAYDHRDAAGFIRLNALRLRTLGQRRKKLSLRRASEQVPAPAAKRTRCSGRRSERDRILDRSFGVRRHDLRATKSSQF